MFLKAFKARMNSFLKDNDVTNESKLLPEQIDISVFID